MPGNYHFIDAFDSTSAPPSEIRRARNSHAVREAHARQRRLRTIKHQAALRQDQTQDLDDRLLISPIGRDLRDDWGLWTLQAKRLSPQEHVLLEHCT